MALTRPDYQRLSSLRQLFPTVPILALSATCPPIVLRDLLKTLQMGAPIIGTGESLSDHNALLSAKLWYSRDDEGHGPLFGAVVPEEPSLQCATKTL